MTGVPAFFHEAQARIERALDRALAARFDGPPVVRDAMIAFSKGETKQLLRSIITLSEGRLFGVMPGAMGAHAPFGAKLISVFHDNFEKGVPSHQGVVVLYDPTSGAPVCVRRRLLVACDFDVRGG